jgi:DNA-binding NtrC family response regulator
VTIPTDPSNLRDSIASFLSYTWPGNARQPENEIKRLVDSVRGKSITDDHLDGAIRNLSASVQSFQPKEDSAPKSPTSRSLPDAVKQLERRLIEEALRNFGGNKQKRPKL